MEVPVETPSVFEGVFEILEQKSGTHSLEQFNLSMNPFEFKSSLANFFRLLLCVVFLLLIMT